MMGLGKPQQHGKFEVAIFSRCKNNKGEPSKFWGLPTLGGRPFCLLGAIV